MPGELHPVIPNERMQGEAGLIGKLAGGALALAVAAGGIAYAADRYDDGTTQSGDESARIELIDGDDDSTPTTAAGIDGTVTAGDDATIAEEDAAGLYECGGVKNEDWRNDDGSEKPFTPDAGLIPHMNAHPELAESDQDFWVNVMGAEAFDYLAANAYTNNAHDDEAADLDVSAVDQTYEDYLEKQVATPVTADVVVQNHACKDAEGNYYVRPVGLKHLPAGQAYVTGNVLSQDKYDEFTELLEDGAEEQLLTYQVDTDGDDKNDAVVIVTKHRQCGNNILLTDVPVPEKPETPTTGGPTPTTPGGPGTTNTTRPTGSTRPEVTTPASAPIQGEGAGGNPDDDNDPNNNTTTSTTAASQSTGTTGTTMRPSGPTAIDPVPPTTDTTVIGG